jgi:hypothetical protein
MTLDRIVSLQDYEDFARAFAGIAKATATVLWSGERRVVHVTVAGADGDAVDPSSDVYRNLVRSLSTSGDPAQQVIVTSYQPLFFVVSAQVLVDPRFVPEDVLAEVQRAVQEAFSFDRRSFAQPVTAAEVVTVIQGVDGVTATTLFQLYLITDPSGPAQASPASVLSASTARSEGGEVRPAQLLQIAPAGVHFSEMTA